MSKGLSSIEKQENTKEVCRWDTDILLHISSAKVWWPLHPVYMTGMALVLLRLASKVRLFFVIILGRREMFFANRQRPKKVAALVVGKIGSFLFKAQLYHLR